VLTIISAISEGRQTAIDTSWNTELQCGHVEVVEEIENDPDGVSNESTVGPASPGFGSSCDPITGPFFLAILRIYQEEFLQILQCRDLVEKVVAVCWQMNL
jgi:hypothetical protein